MSPAHPPPHFPRATGELMRISSTYHCLQIRTCSSISYVLQWEQGLEQISMDESYRLIEPLSSDPYMLISYLCCIAVMTNGQIE